MKIAFLDVNSFHRSIHEHNAICELCKSHLDFYLDEKETFVPRDGMDLCAVVTIVSHAIYLACGSSTITCALLNA